jgi:hypothetical protein
MWAEWFAKQADPRLGENLGELKRKQEYFAAVNRRTPRKFTYTCQGPICRGEIMGTDPVPDYYTAAPCWACGRDQHTEPRPTFTRADDDALIEAYEKETETV